MPTWGDTEVLNSLDLEDICYFNVQGKRETDWEEVPEDIKNTFDAEGNISFDVI